MFTISQDQLSLMRKKKIREGLIKTFGKSGQSAETDHKTGDTLVTDLNDNITRFVFDNFGYIGDIISPLGRKWHFKNDDQGKLLELINPAGFHLKHEYNDYDLLTSVKGNSETIFSLHYKDQSKLSRIEYPDKTSNIFDYNDKEALSSVTDRLNHKEKFEFDEYNNLTAVIDENGNRTDFEYGNWNRPDRVIYPDKSTESYQYTPKGLVNEIISNSKTTSEIDYNDKGKPVSIRYRDGNTLSFEYDDQGNIIRADSSEHIVAYKYNKAGQVIQEDQNGRIVKYEYDKAGSLTGMVYPSEKRVKFGYDKDLRIKSIIDFNNKGHYFNYFKNDKGFDLVMANGLISSKYNDSRLGLELIRVSKESFLDNRKELFSLTYDYDKENRVSRFIDSDFGDRKYLYDAESRLLSVDSKDENIKESFSYDPAGNRTGSGSKKAKFDNLNRLVMQGHVKCYYDERGNMIRKSCKDTGKTWRFTYNKQNLLVEAESGSGERISFKYDAFGRRILKKTEEGVVQYLWAGEQLISEIRVTDKGAETREYLYIPGTQAPFAMRIDQDVFYYHTDHLGTPRRLTDDDGKVVWASDYKAFGEIDIKVNDISNSLRFPGQWHDKETNLYYNRFRYYSPVLGRYITRDPVTYLSGLNFYSYVNNNPINNADPMGLLWGLGGLASGIISAAAAIAVGVAVVALAPIALPLAIVAAGVAAGAVGFGLNETLNRENFCISCTLKAMGKGAVIGGAAALPFAFMPATAGVAAYAGVGGASGAIGYTTEHLLTSGTQWNWNEFGAAVGIGAATAGIGRYLGPKFGRWRKGRVKKDFTADLSKTKAKTRNGHSYAGNKQLHEKMSKDFKFRRKMENNYGKNIFERTSTSGNGRRNPNGAQWHHDNRNPKRLHLMKKDSHSKFHQDNGQEGGWHKFYKNNK